MDVMTRRSNATPWALVVALVVIAGIAPMAVAKTASVKADNFDFSPSTVKIKKNDRVRWKNVAGTHTVTMSSGGQNLDEPLSGSGSVTSKKFKKRGTFKYRCSFHRDQGMKGKVVVK